MSKDIKLNYINNSPLVCDNQSVDSANMSENQLLEFVDGELLVNDLYQDGINGKSLRLLQISDTHNRHLQLPDLPDADVIIHCGDFTEQGTEEETLDFLNWFNELPYMHKIFITGNHDLCLWDADDIEELPDNVHFLQDRGCEIEGVKFFGLAYNHSESLINGDIDVLITHEPPVMILDESSGVHWGNAYIRNRVLQVKPRFHLFGHAHDAYGMTKQDGIVFANGASMDDHYNMRHKPQLIYL